MRMHLSVVFEKDDLERIIQISNLLGTNNKRMVFDIENDIGEEGLCIRSLNLSTNIKDIPNTVKLLKRINRNVFSWYIDEIKIIKELVFP